ncbi:MAG: DUF6927 domain-containing protein, partial [Desulfotomaculales bacterium]
DDENALRWREKCWENIRKRKARPKLTKGAIIEFAEPVTFRNGLIKKNVFRVVDPRQLIFECDGMLCKLRRSILQEKEWKLVQEA